MTLPKATEALFPSDEMPRKPTRGRNITDVSIPGWLKRIRWVNFTLLIVIPVAAFIQAFWLPLHANTFGWATLYYFMTLGSVTAGYHRLWAHRSYVASTPLKYLLAAFGAGAVQGSIKFWVREHRAHHRFTDTDRDPYNIKEGLLYAHILWALAEQPKKNNRVDISDLQNDPVVVYQHKYYFPIALFMGWTLPSLVAGLGWGDWYGGFIYAGIIRSFLVNQATFCVNSLAHYLGDQPFDDRRSPRDHLLTALITLGEGYHNFHHEFPSDYRNGIEWHQVDITKWIIRLFECLRLASNLKRSRQSEIEKGRIQQIYKKLEKRSNRLDWGRPLNELPLMGWDEYQMRVKNDGQLLIIVEGVIYDVSGFINDHPGGELMIRSGIGKDNTTSFNGAVYNHSNAARNILLTLRVAVLRGGCETSGLH